MKRSTQRKEVAQSAHREQSKLYQGRTGDSDQRFTVKEKSPFPSYEHEILTSEGRAFIGSRASIFNGHPTLKSVCLSLLQQLAISIKFEAYKNEKKWSAKS
jgi:hypothetical protein